MEPEEYRPRPHHLSLDQLRAAYRKQAEGGEPQFKRLAEVRLGLLDRPAAMDADLMIRPDC